MTACFVPAQFSRFTPPLAMANVITLHLSPHPCTLRPSIVGLRRADFHNKPNTTGISHWPRTCGVEGHNNMSTEALGVHHLRRNKLWGLGWAAIPIVCKRRSTAGSDSAANHGSNEPVLHQGPRAGHAISHWHKVLGIHRSCLANHPTLRQNTRTCM